MILYGYNDICFYNYCKYHYKGGECMEQFKRFISYQELADAIGCSYQQIQKVHAKRIIELFDVDVSRLPKSGVLPLECCYQYFDVTTPINKNTH